MQHISFYIIYMFFQSLFCDIVIVFQCLVLMGPTKMAASVFHVRSASTRMKQESHSARLVVMSSQHQQLAAAPAMSVKVCHKLINQLLYKYVTNSSISCSIKIYMS